MSSTYLHDLGADQVNVTRVPRPDDRRLVIDLGSTNAVGVRWYGTPEQVRAVLAEIGRQVDIIAGGVTP